MLKSHNTVVSLIGVLVYRGCVTPDILSKLALAKIESVPGFMDL